MSPNQLNVSQGDVRGSRAYIQAMKALQQKIKGIEAENQQLRAELDQQK